MNRYSEGEAAALEGSIYIAIQKDARSALISIVSLLGEKYIGIVILMPKQRRSIRIERHFCCLGVEGKQEFTRLALRAKTVSRFLGKLDIESAVPEFPGPVCQLHHPDIWSAVGRTGAAVCT